MVDDIKRRVADLIDLCETMRKETADPETDAERNRLVSIAQTHLEHAAMWVVKAITIGPRDTYANSHATLLAGPCFAADLRAESSRVGRSGLATWRSHARPIRQAPPGYRPCRQKPRPGQLNKVPQGRYIPRIRRRTRFRPAGPLGRPGSRRQWRWRPGASSVRA